MLNLGLRRSLTLRIVMATTLTAAACGSFDQSGPITMDDLERMSLQLSDLPSGWTEEAIIDEEQEGFLCFENDDFRINRDSWPVLNKEFSGGADGPFAFFSVAAAPDVASAKDAIAEYAHLAETCSIWEDEDGTYTLHPVMYPTVGDETFVVRLTAEIDGLTFVADSVFVREGRIMWFLGSVGVDKPVNTETVVGWMEVLDDRD